MHTVAVGAAVLQLPVRRLFLYRAAASWNALPVEVTAVPNPTGNSFSYKLCFPSGHDQLHVTTNADQHHFWLCWICAKCSKM